MTDTPLLYFVDDDRGIREVYGLAFETGFRVMSFPHIEELLEVLNRGGEHPRIIVTDNDTGTNLTGHQLIVEELPRIGYQGKVLMVSGTVPEAASYPSLTKPFSIRILRSTIDGLLG